MLSLPTPFQLEYALHKDCSGLACFVGGSSSSSTTTTARRSHYIKSLVVYFLLTFDAPSIDDRLFLKNEMFFGNNSSLSSENEKTEFEFCKDFRIIKWISKSEEQQRSEEKEDKDSESGAVNETKANRDLFSLEKFVKEAKLSKVLKKWNQNHEQQQQQEADTFLARVELQQQQSSTTNNEQQLLYFNLIDRCIVEMARERLIISPKSKETCIVVSVKYYSSEEDRAGKINEMSLI